MNRMEKLLAYLQDQPNDPFLRHALALEYQKTGQLEEAIKIWRQLLNDSPDYVGSYYHLAAALTSQNAVQEALEWYEKGLAVAKKAGDNHAWNELRMAYDDLMDN
jgi:tetratricopeptide (TPR) repeat protein